MLGRPQMVGLSVGLEADASRCHGEPGAMPGGTGVAGVACLVWAVRRVALDLQEGSADPATGEVAERQPAEARAGVCQWAGGQWPP